MCNLYSFMRARAEAAKLARAMVDRNNNQPPMPGVYPDYAAPIVRTSAGGAREMVDARWGMPSPTFALPASGVDRGVTNVRNTASAHWRRWLGPENRCLVPFTSFAEPNQANRSENVWFALGDERPLAFFAGVWTPWTSVRKAKEGKVTCDVYAILTTEPNAVVGAIHSKAMPVILSDPDECETWLTAPWEVAGDLQRPLPDGVLTIVARGIGARQDDFVPAQI